MTALLAVAAFSCCSCMAVPLAHLVTHVTDLGYQPAHGAGVLSTSLAFGSISAFFGVGYLIRHLDGLGALLLFSAGMSAFCASFFSARDLVTLYFCGGLYGLGYGGVLLCYPVIVREHLPANRSGLYIGVIMLIASCGMAVGSWVGGVAYDRYQSYRVGFLFGAAADLVNLGIVLYLIATTRGCTRMLPKRLLVKLAGYAAGRASLAWKSQVDEVLYGQDLDGSGDYAAMDKAITQAPQFKGAAGVSSLAHAYDEAEHSIDVNTRIDTTNDGANAARHRQPNGRCTLHRANEEHARGDGPIGGGTGDGQLCRRRGVYRRQPGGAAAHV